MKIIYHEYTINGFGQVRVYENDGGGYKKWDLRMKLGGSDNWQFAYFTHEAGIFLQDERIDDALPSKFFWMIVLKATPGSSGNDSYIGSMSISYTVSGKRFFGKPTSGPVSG